MSFKPDFIKEYVDHAVQTTSSPPSPLRSLDASGSVLVKTNLQLEVFGLANELSSTNDMRPSFDLNDASSDSLVSLTSSPARSITTTRRTFKPQQLPVHFPSQVLKADSLRTVSLPETTSLYSAKSQIGSRIVSMPEHLKSLVHSREFTIYSSDYNDISLGSIDSLALGPSESPHATGSPNLAGIPHTPSPPSSPESVVIIENKYQLSDAFLRNNHAISEHKDTAGEGWVTWAKSPPRPIPALHGPLSLPYARCPSGAEGTVIEEQDNLPRMIWGLGADHPGGTDEAPQTTTHRELIFHPNIPPRLQKQESTVRQPTIPRMATVHSEPENARINTRAVLSDREFKYPAQFNQTIDLSHLVAQNRLQDASNSPQSGSRTITSRTQAAQVFEDTRLRSNSESQQYNWPSVQQRLPDTALLPSSRGQAVLQSKPLVSTQPAAGSSRPVIFLDSQSNSVSLPPPRRVSAIEIAQKFRQQQSLLPTPPTSSSPQWSSNFSPYQDSMLSPEAIILSSLSPDIQQDIAQRLRRSVYEHVANSFNDARLAPAAQIEPRAAVQGNGSYGQDSLSNPLPRRSYTQVGNIPTSPLSDVTYLRPPPNTPLPPVPSSRSSDSSHKKLQPTSVETSSPASPSENRVLRHRSVPLSRLVQRRLSAVPEISEDPSLATMGPTRSPSPPQFQHNFHLSCVAPHNVQLLPPLIETLPVRPPVHYQQSGKSAGKEFERRFRHGESVLPAYERTKLQQSHRTEFVDARENGNQAFRIKTGSNLNERRDILVNGDNIDMNSRGQAQFAKRKARGKKKHASTGGNTTIAT